MDKYSSELIREVAKRNWNNKFSLEKRYKIVEKELSEIRGMKSKDRQIEKDYLKRINKWLKNYLNDEINNDDVAYVYALFDPETFEIKYIGRTIDLKNRYKGHIKEAVDKSGEYYKSVKNIWIQSIFKNGLFPTMGVIEVTTIENYKKAEDYWITHYKKMGYNIVNTNSIKDGVFLQKMR